MYVRGYLQGSENGRVVTIEDREKGGGRRKIKGENEEAKKLDFFFQKMI
jgi:hypothetical protein